MSQASEGIAKQFSSAIMTNKVWGGIVVNVKAFGAEGDGETDDTKAIQKAIDYAISIGKEEVTFPAGSYKYGVLTNTAGITFIGDGVTLNGTTPITLVAMSQLADIAINVKSFGAKGDGVTDDSQAIKNAIAYMCSFAKVITGTTGAGYKSFMPTLYFPTGRYVISQKGALNCVGSTLQGYNIKGGGYQSTEILYTYTPSVGETNDHLLINGGSNWFARSYIEDLTIRGNGTNRFWKITSQNGAPQANRFRRVAFLDLLDCVTVEYGSANANADLFRFESCVARGINGWIFGIPGVQNSQSVVHSFHDCDFESINGKFLYFASGGCVEIRGGSWVINKTGRVIHCEDNGGTGIGTSNSFFNFYGTRFEWQHRDLTDAKTDYYPLFYNNSNAKIKFFNCNFGQFQTAGHQFTKYDHGLIHRIGTVVFQDCYLPTIMSFKIEIKGVESRGDRTPSLEFRECKFDAQLADSVNVSFIDNPGAAGRNPTVYADRCRSYSVFEPIDVQLFKDFGSRFTTSNRHVYSATQGDTPTVGLPAKVNAGDPDKVFTFKLPKGAILRKVNIIFKNAANGSSYTVAVKNFDDSTTFVTGTHAPSSISGAVADMSADLYYPIDTEEKRTIRVIGNGATIASGGISGYVEVEYD